jgi:D-alanyl-D-alanine carboxypeptidase
MRTFSQVSWIRAVLFALAAIVWSASPAFADKYAAVVVNMDTGQVLHDRNGDAPRYPASLTKVMTLYLVFEALDSGKLDLSDRMKVSRAAARAQPSKLGLKEGATIKVDDAIRALVTKSANDVAIVIAEKLGGTEAKFVAQMNAKAKELGMLSTTFRNSSGLPDSKQVTTARDMARLGEAIYMDHRNRYSYFSLPSFTWSNRKHLNHNELLKSVAGVDGIKTGFTNASGYNLMASAERDGQRVLAIMMGGKTGRARDNHVADLIEAAFLDLNGATMMAGDIREQLAFGAYGDASADDLALAQLRRLQQGDLALTELDIFDSNEDSGRAGFLEVSTEEDEMAYDSRPQGDGDDNSGDPIGDLIETRGTTGLRTHPQASSGPPRAFVPR